MITTIKGNKAKETIKTQKNQIKKVGKGFNLFTSGGLRDDIT